MITTFAGRAGVCGAVDGAPDAALLCGPSGLAFDANGNLFAIDGATQRVRKISPAGTVSTFAGRPIIDDMANGQGAAAQFRRPAGIALDAAGNIFVADLNNNVIRKLTPEGVMSTVAGSTARNGESGSADGVGPAARFSLPGTIALDSAGNIYVAGTGNSTVRVVTPAGAVSTLVGVAGQYEVHEGPLAARLAGGITVSISPGDRLHIASANAILKVEWRKQGRVLAPRALASVVAFRPAQCSDCCETACAGRILP